MNVLNFQNTRPKLMWFARRWSEFQMWWIVCWRTRFGMFRLLMAEMTSWYRCILATSCLSSSIPYRCVLRHQSPARSFQLQCSHRGQRHDWGSSNLDVSDFPTLMVAELNGLHGRGRKRVKAEVEEVEEVRESQLQIDLINWWWRDTPFDELLNRCNHQWCLIKQRFRRRQGEDSYDLSCLGHEC